MKTSVNETEVSLNSSCQTEAFILVLENCIFLIIRSCFDKHDWNDYNDYKDDWKNKNSGLLDNNKTEGDARYV